MSPRLLLGVMGVFAAAVSGAARTPAVQAAEIAQQLKSLSAFDYATRTRAARLLRRAPVDEVVPALVAAARGHADQYVRARSLVLLTAFNVRETPEIMRGLLGDRNDRVREVVYRWFERYPEPALAPMLLAALETEQAEFVRPALVRAIAALPPDELVQRTLVREVGRGFDFFRSAVIEALGEHRAAYAIDAIAAVAALDGPLQDDAVLALGRIGGNPAVQALPLLPPDKASPSTTAALQAAGCLLGGECHIRLDWLAGAARDTRTRPEAVRAAVAALGAVAQQHADARAVLLALADGTAAQLQYEVAIALSTMALRQPEPTIRWLAELAPAERARVTELLADAFRSLEEDFAEEQFFAAARAAYWDAGEGSNARAIVAALIDRLEF